jgi:NAD(P)-dependent dehydrogenase (short-subunit alcohol dehydrogenase family)
MNILVTGAKSGLGLAITQQLFLNPNTIIAISSTSDGIREVTSGFSRLKKEGARGRVAFFEADVSNYSQISESVSEAVSIHGPIDSVVACAGILTKDSVLDLTSDQLSRCISVNTIGCFNIFKACLDSMIKRRRGRLIGIGSMEALNCSFGFTSYAASKAALMSLIYGMSKEVSKLGIGVYCVFPGNLRTKINMSGETEPGLAAKQIINTFLSSHDPLPQESTFWICNNKETGKCEVLSDRSF